MLAAEQSKATVVLPQKLIEEAKSTKTIDGVRIIPEEVTVPPPPILWYWLSYIYQTTGEWWLPPKTSVSAATQLEGFPAASYIDRESEANFSDVTKKAAKTIANRSFNYRNSEYFRVAQQIIKQYAPEAAEPNSSKKTEVLAFILAWSCHPLFKDNSDKFASNNLTLWMTMSRQRCARELQMRPTNFIEICDWLEAQGIIQIDDPSSGVITPETFNQFLLKVQGQADNRLVQQYWPGRSLTNKIKLYRLRIQIPDQSSLPIFNYPESVEIEPLCSNSNSNKLSLVDPLEGEGLSHTEIEKGKDFSEISQTKTSFALTTNKPDNTRKDFPRTFPVKNNETYNQPEHDHEFYNHKKLNPQRKNHDCHATFPNKVCEPDTEPDKALVATRIRNHLKVMSTTEIGLEPEQIVKLDFLKRQARFEGFSGAKGRVTLDYNPAIKLACHPALSLESLQKIYQEVHERWLNGELENPVGYFHTSLKNSCNNFEKQPSLSSAKNFRKTLNPNKVKSNRAAASWQSVVGSNNLKPEEPAQRPIPPSFSSTLNHSDFDWNTLASNKPLTITIWEKIRAEDLSGRFRLSSNALRTLEGSGMSVKLEGSALLEGVQPKVIIRLRSELELKTLDHQLKNLIRMALSQRFGSGYVLEFVT